MSGIRIIGMGRCIPSVVCTNEDLAKYMDTSDEWIRSRTGIISRRYCAPEENLETLAVGAARDAIGKAHIRADEIGLIVVATATPESITPSTACHIQEALHIPAGIPAFDINAACSGFVYALQIADALMARGDACSEDAAERPYALVVGAERLSKLLDFSDRSVSVLFGDGAGCAVVEYDRQVSFYCHAASDGCREALHAGTVGRNDLEISGDRNPFGIDGQRVQKTKDDAWLRMDGREVFRFAVRVLQEEIERMSAMSGIPTEQIDYIVCHQANRRIIDHVAKKLKIPAGKCFMDLDHFGNTSGASIPLALSEMWDLGMLKRGTKIFTAGFGAGLTWAGAYLEF